MGTCKAGGVSLLPGREREATCVVVRAFSIEGASGESSCGMLKMSRLVNSRSNALMTVSSERRVVLGKRACEPERG